MLDLQLVLVPGQPSLHRLAVTTPCRRKIATMQVTTGIVIDGKVVVEGVPLVEGATVAVLSREPEQPFTLTAEDEAELVAAMSEIERGEFVSATALLESLRQYG